MSGEAFVGVLHFPWALPVQRAVLGSSFPALIADQSIEITLPQLTEAVGEEEDSPLARNLAAPAGIDLPAALSAVADDQRHYGWGYVAESDRCMVSTAIASSDGRLDPIAVSHGFHEWIELVRDWISAWLRTPSIDLATSRGTAMSWLREDGTYTGAGGSVNSVVVSGSPAADSQTVRGAFNNASSGVQLPAAHRLLLQARNSMWSKDLRAAVIDAGTAAEVALGAAIASDLGTLGVLQDFIDSAIEAANGFVGLYAFHVSLGHTHQVSKNRVMNQLARIRNRAAHAGNVPDEAESRSALETATSLVDSAIPMPPP
jgi:hypothetical protein